MKTFFKIFGAFVLTMIASTSFASREEFCAGFSEGYKSIKGEYAMVPICPIPPVTPIGSTPFREGIKAGIRAAQK